MCVLGVFPHLPILFLPTTPFLLRAISTHHARLLPLQLYPGLPAPSCARCPHRLQCFCPTIRPGEPELNVPATAAADRHCSAECEPASLQLFAIPFVCHSSTRYATTLWQHSVSFFTRHELLSLPAPAAESSIASSFTSTGHGTNPTLVRRRPSTTLVRIVGDVWDDTTTTANVRIDKLPSALPSSVAAYHAPAQSFSILADVSLASLISAIIAWRPGAGSGWLSFDNRVLPIFSPL